MKKVLKRVLACALAVVMIFQYLPDKGNVSEAASDTTSKPVIGKQVNLAQSATTLPTAFDTNTNRLQYIDLGAAEVQGNTWYFTGKFTYTGFAENGGLTFVFGEYEKDGATKTLSVQARPYGVSDGIPSGTNYNIWTDASSNNLSGVIENNTISGAQAWDTSVKYALNTGYSFTVKVSDGKLSMWIDDKAWYQNLDLSSVVTGITPKFGFHCDGTTGTISDIKIWDDVQTNLALEAFGSLPTVFNTGNEKTQNINLGNLLPAEGHEDSYTYYFSGKFTYTNTPTSGSSGLAFQVGDITYSDSNTAGNLTVYARRYYADDGTLSGTNYLLSHSPGTAYFSGEWMTDVKYTANVEHRWTVKVTSTGQLELWIDDINWTEKAGEDAGDFSSATFVAPKFCLYSDAAEGTLKDIQIWGELEVDGVPKIGDNENLVDRLIEVPSKFDSSNSSSTLKFKNLATVGDSPVWYYSAKFKYTSLNTSANAFGGLKAVFGIGEKADGSTTDLLSVTSRPHMNGSGVPDYSQNVVWNGNSSIDDSLITTGPIQKVNEEFQFTVKADGTKVSYWIDNVNIFNEVDLGNYDIVSITPNLGIARDGASGEVWDYQVWGDLTTATAPTMSADDVNLAEGRTMPTSFTAGTTEILDLGKIQTTSDNPTWYYSGKFTYQSLTSGTGGLTPIYAEGVYNGSNTNLSVTARPNGSGSTQVVIWAGSTALSAWGNAKNYVVGEEYIYTVVFSDNKVSLWIDNTLIIEEFNLASKGVTNITPKFGSNPDGTSGTISDIKVWGDLERLTAPTMGADDVNLAEGRTVPTEFGSGTQILDLGKIQATSDSPAWYYSGTFQYTKLASGYGGLTFIFGEGIYNGESSKRDLAITARPTGEGDTQVVLWARFNGDALINESRTMNYVEGTDYVYTVIVSNNKLTFWIDETLIVDNFDLTSKGVTNITPKFGLIPDGTSGTISDIKVWGDLERVNPATKPEGLANLTKEAGEIVEFKAGTNQYYNNEKINISGDSWYYSGTFEYTSIPAWGGITFVFGEGVYDYTLLGESAEHSAPVVGQRELSVTARAAGGSVQKVLWADTLAVDANAVSGLTLEIDKEYTWTIEVENGLLTFWINDTLIYDELNLASYGVTNVTPKFGIKPDGSNGTVSNVQIWDTVTVASVPVFTTTDTNESLFENVNVTASTGRLQYEGITYGDSYYYSADVNETSEDGSIRMILGNSANGTVEVYYAAGTGYLVEHTSSGDTNIASKAVSVDVSNECNYKVKNESGTISFWVNDTLILNQVVVAGLTADAGIASECTGTVSNILLWGDVTRETQAILYQKFEDISPYRGTAKTYPKAVGYVFGGWYTDANESSPVSTSTTTGNAYAKLVPEDVLRVMAQTNKDTTYSSSAPTNLRFVTTVDSKRYSEISFDVTFKGVKRELKDVYVYSSIKVRDNENEFKYAPSYFHEQSEFFYTYSVTNISSAIFDVPFTVVPRWTTLDGTNVFGIEREIAVNDNNNKRWTTEQLGENGLGGSKLLQLATEKDANQMMSYVIEAYNPTTPNDPYVIVIDGGEEKDAAYLYWVLTNKYAGEVDAWFITHEHDDHYGALFKMLKDDQIGEGDKQVSINNLYYNFPDNITHGEGPLAFIEAINKCSHLSEKVAEQVMGQTYTYGRVNITVLSDCDEYYGQLYADNAAGDQNNASIIMLAEFDDDDANTENTKVLFLGDLGRTGEAYIMKQVNDLNVNLTGVAVQMAHHGNGGVSKAFYDALDPIACLWPCTNWLWENMPQGTDEPGTGNWENVELHQFLLSQGVDKHYTAAYGNYEFN